MQPIISEIDEKIKFITFPFFIEGYGAIKDHSDWRMFCRRYELLRSAYNQLVRIMDEVQGESHGV